ncbi:MAG: hypothetical protein LBU73_04410 [Helicobacteraceae bacterium]|jgi:septation ring formation regulator EzrA|nr:hypothetical protein [Helicobacteraceae bacterium]
MKITAVCLLPLIFATLASAADPDMIGRREFANFYISDSLKEEIRAEIMRDINASFEAAKTELFEQVQRESERQRKLYTAQVEEIARQLAKIKEELDFVRELVVDANYLRNSNADVVAGLKKELDALTDRLKTLENAALKETPPEIPQGERKL